MLLIGDLVYEKLFNPQEFCHQEADLHRLLATEHTKKYKQSLVKIPATLSDSIEPCPEILK